MRVLLTTYADKPLLQAMVPLAWAARTAGHEVWFASQPELRDDVTMAGLTAVPVGRNSGLWRLAELAPKEVEAGREGLPPPFDAPLLAPEQASWASMADGYDLQVFQWHKLQNGPMIGDLVRFARQWRPDLILWEPTTYAGAIAARACGAAHGRLLWSIDLFAATRERYLDLKRQQPPDQRRDALADWLAPYARQHGTEFDEEMVVGQFTIDQLPASMRMTAAGLRYLPMRYVPYGGAAVVPGWLRSAPARPRVALMLGITATSRYQGYVADVQSILNAVADLDVELVVAIAEKEQAKLDTVPDNARVVSYLPLHALAPTCSAIIHHAGPGTLRTSTYYGVPQLALPWDFDEPELARRLAAQGAALVLNPRHATATMVREALVRLLTEPGFREAAARVRDEMHAAPAPTELVGQLERLTDGLRSRPGATVTR